MGWEGIGREGREFSGKWREHERRGGGGKGGERREKRGREGEGKTEGDGPPNADSWIRPLEQYRAKDRALGHALQACNSL